ncbi:cobalamin B12-binding domain-containing protein, partial [Patescibacteria group bacterium]|nr:cobalamin B12-binding domain-containing protein [Patescibacteria group bacterium]
MKIVFIAMSTENLALSFLSSFLKKHGHQVDMVFDPTLFQSETINAPKLAKFFDTQDQIAQQVVSKKPDLVGFSVFTLNYQRTLTLAKKIKKLNKNLPII